MGTKRSKTARHRKSSARSGMAGVSANLQITICFRSSGRCGCLRLLQNPVTNSRLSVGRCQVTLLFNDCAIGLRSPCIRQTMRCWNSREALGLPGQACCRPPQQQFSCWASDPPPFPLFVASIPVGLPPVFLASLVLLRLICTAAPASNRRGAFVVPAHAGTHSPESIWDEAPTPANR